MVPFRRWLRRIRTTLFHLIQPQHAQEIIARESMGEFTAELANGFKVELTCDRITHCEAGSYGEDVINEYMYHLKARCLGNVPDPIREACRLEIFYPTGSLQALDNEWLFDTMTNHYLHLINKRLSVA